MEESASVRRWKLAERLERKSQHPNVSPELRERALRLARLLKKAVELHETRKLTKILEKHKQRESR
jgi:uncharacterized protein (DUF2384 family)